MTHPSSEIGPASTIRAILIWTLLGGSLGMLLELLLIGHDEMATQLAPIVLLAAGILVVAWMLIAPRLITIRTLQVLMAAFVVSGVVGVGLHYKGNEAFELEMMPSRGGLSLLAKTLTGATPVLAPGSMALLGVVGLALTHRHPLLRSRQMPEEES